MSSFSVYPHIISCKYIMDMLTTTFILWKGSIYFLFLERLFSVFENTSFSFKKYKIKISRILLSLYGLFLISCSWIWGEGYYDEQNKVCLAAFPIWASALIAGGDLFIGILVSVLFTRNLLYLGLSSPESSLECTYTATYATPPVITKKWEWFF